MRISKKQLFGAALLAGLTLMSVNFAFAQDAQDAPAGGQKDQAPKKEMTIEEYFTKLDVNADGKLVDGEIKAGQLKDWDTNADGAVTLEELKAAIAKRNQPKPKPTAEQKFKEMDKNADGKVVPEEFPKPEMFAAIDADKNGEITLDEVKAFMAKQDQPKPKVTIEERFKKIDKNADGKITPDEIPNAEHFAKVDTDKDGAITLEEFKAFMSKDQPREQPKDKPKDKPNTQPGGYGQ
jgi:Ca2+-binding EF-hand superfamily protein